MAGVFATLTGPSRHLSALPGLIRGAFLCVLGALRGSIRWSETAEPLRFKQFSKSPDHADGTGASDAITRRPEIR